jgi:hypothetical protein
MANSLRFTLTLLLSVILCVGCCNPRVYRCGTEANCGISGRFSDCNSGACRPSHVGHGLRNPVGMLCKKLTCGHGCSNEIYWDEWYSDPPDACDPCNRCGQFVGQRCCPPAWKDRLGTRLSGRYGNCNSMSCTNGCSSDCETCNYETGAEEYSTYEAQDSVPAIQYVPKQSPRLVPPQSQPKTPAAVEEPLPPQKNNNSVAPTTPAPETEEASPPMNNMRRQPLLEPESVPEANTSPPETLEPGQVPNQLIPDTDLPPADRTPRLETSASRTKRNTVRVVSKSRSEQVNELDLPPQRAKAVRQYLPRGDE